MASYYPHKQTALIAILCVIAVGGTYIYAKGGISSISEQKAPPFQENIAFKAPEKPISTSTDWRKSFLVGTSSSSSTTHATKTSTQENLTLTDQFGRDFFARYIQLKQSGLRENQDFVTDTLNTSIDKAVRSATQAKAYGTADISIQTNATTANLKAYGNAVGTIFSKYGVDEDPATVANDAFEQGDMKLLGKLDPIMGQYATIVAMLKITPVPQPLVQHHLSLMNAVSGMLKITQDLRNVEGDPMQAMVSIGQYATVHGSQLTALRSIKAYFSTIPIVFAATEPGSLFSLNL